VCAGCNETLDDGEQPTPEDAQMIPTYNGEPDDLVYVINKDVEHPPFVDEGYHCALCDCELTEEDD
jgi:hypothetical protein